MPAGIETGDDLLNVSVDRDPLPVDQPQDGQISHAPRRYRSRARAVPVGRSWDSPCPLQWVETGRGGFVFCLLERSPFQIARREDGLAIAPANTRSLTNIRSRTGPIAHCEKSGDAPWAAVARPFGSSQSSWRPSAVRSRK